MKLIKLAGIVVVAAVVLTVLLLAIASSMTRSVTGGEIATPKPSEGFRILLDKDRFLVSEPVNFTVSTNRSVYLGSGGGGTWWTLFRLENGSWNPLGPRYPKMDPEESCREGQFVARREGVYVPPFVCTELLPGDLPKMRIKGESGITEWSYSELQKLGILPVTHARNYTDLVTLPCGKETYSTFVERVAASGRYKIEVCYIPAENVRNIPEIRWCGPRGSGFNSYAQCTEREFIIE